MKLYSRRRLFLGVSVTDVRIVLQWLITSTKTTKGNSSSDSNTSSSCNSKSGCWSGKLYIQLVTVMVSKRLFDLDVSFVPCL